MKLSLTFLQTLIILTVNGQATFQSSYHVNCLNEGFNLIQSLSGDYYFVGESGGCSGPYKTLLGKVNQNGDSVWVKVINNGFFSDASFCIIQSSDGNLVFGGYSNMGSNDIQMQLTKTDTSGNIIWQKYYGQSSPSDYAYDLKETADKGFIIVGSKTPGQLILMDIQLYKTDSLGNLEWVKTYNGNWGDKGYSLIIADSSYIICASQAEFSQGADSSKIFILKTDFSGNLLWSKVHSGTGNYLGREIQKTNDGGFIVAGYHIGIGFSKGYLMKTDDNADTIWTNELGYLASFYSVKQTNDNGYIVTGTTYDTVLSNYNLTLVKFANNGNIQWSKQFDYGKDEVGFDVQITSDNGYAIVGYTRVIGYNDRDVYLLKTDSLGNFLFVSLIENNLVNEKINIYPNPFSSWATLQTDNFLIEATITFYNVFGQTIKQMGNISGQTIILHRDNLPIGLYFVQLTQDNKVIATEKLIITE